ncbi:MAG: dicarboxylate/amino acid:cation symporter [Myxococcales bacterium]|nr:dicarboxylate/amino acid:cation symporter [Myxococcales bacterium]
MIIGAMVLGAVLGPLFGPHAASLGVLGKLVIQLIKAIATPLLFFAILHAVLTTEIDARAGVRMLGIATLNTVIAIVIGLTLSNVLKPGRELTVVRPSAEAAAVYAGKKVELSRTFASYVPTNLVSPFEENLAISIIGIALVMGFALRRVRAERRSEGRDIAPIEEGLGAMLRALEIALTWVLKLIPLAVFGVVAMTVAEHGFAPLRGLATYVVVGVLGLALHIGIVYHAWLLFVVRLPLARFWRAAREPVLYALGTNSSLATLPVTLRALDALKIPRSASALGACVGTNLNNDGIVLYEGMAVLFVAQAAGLELSISQQAIAAVICMIAAMGVAGVPEAGFVSLALVLNSVGLPIELLPLLLTVDWIIARARSVTNVLSDMLLSILIDHFGKGDAPTTALESPDG